MDKKKALINTLLGKIQSRSKKLYEDVSNEIWNDIKPADKVDYDLEIDGEEIKTEEDEEEKQLSAMDVILDSPVSIAPKDVEEI